MTTYTTRTLSEAVIGDDAKTSTRTLRKFLRDDTVAKGGKVGIDTPGKGGRYTLDLNKRELTALTKRFKAWEAQQEEDRAKRAADLASKGAIPAPIEAEAAEEPIADEADNGVEGPSDEEIAEMLSDEEEADDEVIED